LSLKGRKEEEEKEEEQMEEEEGGRKRREEWLVPEGSEHSLKPQASKASYELLI